MAFYITINKTSETAEAYTYEFSDAETGKGLLRIEKETGNVAEVIAAPGDTSARRFERAAVKIMRHWKRGEFPDETCWAA